MKYRMFNCANWVCTLHSNLLYEASTIIRKWVTLLIFGTGFQNYLNSARKFGEYSFCDYVQGLWDMFYQFRE